jgi:hypothetical protein
MSKIRPSTKVSTPPRTMAAPGALPAQRPAVQQQLGPLLSSGRGHASQAVLSDLGKLTPSLAAGIRRVAGSK